MAMAAANKAITSLKDIPGNLADLLQRARCEVRDPAGGDDSIKIHALSDRTALTIVPCNIFGGSRIFLYTTRYKMFAPIQLVVPARAAGFQIIDWGIIYQWDAAARQLSAIFPTDLCGREIVWRAVYSVTRPGNPHEVAFPLMRIDELKGCRDDSPWEPIWAAPQWPEGLRVP